MKLKLYLYPILMLAMQHTYALAPTIAPEEVQDVHQNIEEKLKEYYNRLNYLTSSKMEFHEKENSLKAIISEYYAGDTIAMYNDYESKGLQHFRVQEYLDNLVTNYSDERKGFGFSVPQINVSDVFIKDGGELFFVKVEVKKEFYCTTDASLNNSQTIDYYVEFPPNSKSYRIYSMTEHKNNIMMFTKATVQNKIVLAAADNTSAKVAEPSFFVFNISPANADVKIDGRSIYVVNSMKIPVPAGKHKIEISAPGYESYSIEECTANVGLNNFAAVLNPRMGTLSVRNKTQKEIGASIYVDGKFAGVIPADRIPLDEGKHAVRIIKDGYFISSQKVNIQDQKDRPMKVFLVNIENTKKGVATGLNILGNILNNATKSTPPPPPPVRKK